MTELTMRLSRIQYIKISNKKGMTRERVMPFF